MGELWFVGAATTRYTPAFRDATGLDDLPELDVELTRMRDLFIELGFTAAPEFQINLARVEFKARLRSFLRARADDDTVVVYYTGHGVLDQNALHLPMADAGDDVSFSSLPAVDLTGRMLEGTVLGTGEPLIRVKRLLFMLDTCFSGAALGDATANAERFFARFTGPDSAGLMGMVVAARPSKSAGAGLFTQAFVDAVHHRSTGGVEPDFLPLDGIVGVVNDTTPPWQHARHFLTGEAASQFIPNPRRAAWLSGLDVWTQTREQVSTARRGDMRSHVIPRAQGLDTPGRDDLWLFEGRHEALRSACSWLSARAPSTLVVTGDPGSGKSAVLSRLFVLSDAQYRRRIPEVHTLPADTLPPDGSLARFIHAKGLSAEDMMTALCEAVQRPSPTTSPAELLAGLGDGPTVTVMIDALDETAASPQQKAAGTLPAVDRILAPLISAAQRTRLRLVLGTRKHLLPALGTPLDGSAERIAALIDLDDDRYADPVSVRRYIRSCLLDISATSPYKGQSSAYLDDVVDALAAAAGHSFLVALITARSLALSPKQVNPYDREWREKLPREAADAMRDDLDRRLGEQAQRARDLLMPLAYAKGAGLPWEDIWPRLGRQLGDHNCGHDDLDWLMTEAGYYVTESRSDDDHRSVFRLYHESLAEHLRGLRPSAEDDEATITAALIDHTPRRADGTPDWIHAHPYVTDHLATHAAAGRALDDLVGDPRFLLAADPSRLEAALASVSGDQAARAGDAFRRARARLRFGRPGDRAAYLQLSARCARAHELADTIDREHLRLTWATPWAVWRFQPAYQVLAGHTDWPNAVAVGQVEGRTVIVSGGDDGTVRVWDAGTGRPVGDPLTGHTGRVNAVAVGQVEGRTVIASGSDDRSVRVWDAQLRRASVPLPLVDVASPVAAVVLGDSGQLAVGAELGVILIRLPVG